MFILLDCSGYLVCVLINDYFMVEKKKFMFCVCLKSDIILMFEMVYVLCYFISYDFMFGFMMNINKFLIF